MMPNKQNIIVAILLLIAMVTMFLWSSPVAKPSIKDAVRQEGSTGSSDVEEEPNDQPDGPTPPQVPSDSGTDTLYTFVAATPVAGSYMDTMEVKATTSFTLMGTLETVVEDMIIEMDRIVTDASGGGKTVDMITTRVFSDMSMSEPPMDIQCDTDTDGSTTSGTDSFSDDDDDCSEFLDLIGQEMTFELDSNGVVQSSSGQGTEILESSEAITRGAPDLLDQSSQILSFLPSQPVRIGDEWDASASMGKFGDVEGKSIFQGFRGEEGRNCAQFFTEGILHLNQKALEDLVGQDDDLSNADGSNINLKETYITSAFCWDDDLKLVLSSKTHMKISMSLEMDGVLGNKPVDMPIIEDITTKTSLM